MGLRNACGRAFFLGEVDVRGGIGRWSYHGFQNVACCVVSVNVMRAFVRSLQVSCIA